MSHTLLLDIDLPGDLARFKLPASVDERLSALLAKQETTAGLTV